MKDEFDELLKLQKKNRDSKDIQKKMNIYLYKRITIVMIICSLILGCLYVFNPFKPKEEVINYYNPAELTIEGLDNKTSLGLILQSFYRTQFSGVELSLNELKIEEDKYIFRIQEIQDLYTIHIGDKDERAEIILKKDMIDFDSTKTIIMDEHVKRSIARDGDLSKELNDLNELPDSSVLELALVFKDKVSVDELIAFMKKYEDVSFVWGCVDMHLQRPYGINLYNCILYDVNEQFENKYPYLNKFDRYDALQLHQHYLSSLKLLIDYPELSNKLADCFSNDRDIKEQYNEAKEELSFIGVKCYIKKNDLIKGIQNNVFQYGLIEDIRYSKYEK